MTKQLTRQEVEAVVDKLGGKVMAFSREDGHEYMRTGNTDKAVYLDEPVLIGNVLEKMDKSDCFVKSIWGKIKGYGSGLYYNDLVLLWRPLGLSSSLQEIILESEWSHSAHAKVCNVGHEEVLTSPETNALFSFLQEIL